MHAPVPPTTIRLQDGRELRWEGFFVGPTVLDQVTVSAFAPRLLGVDPVVVPVLAAQKLAPYLAMDGTSPRSLLLHSATPANMGFEGDVDDLATGRSPYDVATYIEARSVYLGTSADLTVGRTAPWAEAARLRGVPAVDIGDREHYYLTQAMLVLAEAHSRGETTPVREVIGWLRQHPDAVIRLYALDLEAQILLLWLCHQAGLQRLRIDANKPAVTARWNCKSHLHPTVPQALDLDVAGLRADELLAAEQQLSDGYQRLRWQLPVLPGYTIPRADVERAEFVSGVLAAARLLARRYGVGVGGLKPSTAGDGARIVGDLDLADEDRLAALAAEAHRYGDDYLVEAWVDFRSVTVDGIPYPVAPSGHFRYGAVAGGLTLQTMNRYSWEGNAYVDEAAWAGLGLPVPIYRTIRGALQEVRAAFVGPLSGPEGCYQGLVTGGIDFAVGRVGGYLADRLLVGAIDFNLSSHGAEYMRSFLDEVRTAGTADEYVATRIFRPTPSATLERTEAAVQQAQEHLSAMGMARTVACVPRRWGMLAVTGADLPAAVQGAHAMVNVLISHGLALPPNSAPPSSPRPPSAPILT